jgi:hypothetical protein
MNRYDVRYGKGSDEVNVIVDPAKDEAEAVAMAREMLGGRLPSHAWPRVYCLGGALNQPKPEQAEPEPAPSLEADNPEPAADSAD